LVAKAAGNDVTDLKADTRSARREWTWAAWENAYKADYRRELVVELKAEVTPPASRGRSPGADKLARHGFDIGVSGFENLRSIEVPDEDGRKKKKWGPTVKGYD